MTRARDRSRLSLALALSVGVTGCGRRAPPPPGRAASVLVGPTSKHLYMGGTTLLTPTNGEAPTDLIVTWASSAPAVATVDTGGFVRGVGAGTAAITATRGDRTDTVTVTVAAAPTPGRSVVLAGAGDIAECHSPADDSTAALLGRIGGIVFTLGDNAYPNGFAKNYAECWAPTWGRYQSIVHPAAGNHEYHDDSSSGAADYYRYFFHDHGTIVGDSGRYYYSYDLGTWHIVVLNSDDGYIDMRAGSPEERWLRADLAASTRRCTLAYMHYPRFSSGKVHGSYPAIQPLWQALYDYGAELVLAGHDHEYERFAPQTPDGRADSARGIREFVVGTGGGDLYSFATPLPNSEVRNNTTWGVLKLTLADGAYNWEFIPITGQTFSDSGRGTCH